MLWNRDTKGERDGAGGTLKGDGRGEEGFGNWSMANATLLLRSGETLDWRGLACQRFRHQGLRVNGPHYSACASTQGQGMVYVFTLKLLFLLLSIQKFLISSSRVEREMI